MQGIFSQTEYSLETKFCSLPKDGVQHLKSVKPGLICTLVLKGYEGFLLHFALTKKPKIYHVIYDIMK